MGKKEDSDHLIVVDAKRYHRVKKALEASISGKPAAAPAGLDEKEETRELVVVDVKRYKKVKLELEASEQRYRKLFENVPIGIYRSTPAGRFIDANPALVRMLGYGSFEELAARDLEKEYFDVHFPRCHYLAMLEKEGELKGMEAVWRRKDNTLIHIRENVKLVRAAEGQVYYEGTVEDISQSKRAEEAQRAHTQQIEILNAIISRGNLAESLEEMLEIVLDCVAEPLAFDTAAIFLFDASARTMTLRAQRGGLPGQHLDPRYTSVVGQPFARVLRGESVFVDDVPATLPDLARDWGWRLAGSIPLVAKGRVIGAMNMASSERPAFRPEEKSILEMIGKEAGTLISKLQTETALRESEKYYRTLIDTSPDIIVVLGLDGTVNMINQRFLKVGGYFYDEVIGASTFDFVAGLDRVFLEKKTAAFIDKKTVSGSDYQFKKKDGQVIPLEVSAAVLCDDAGLPKGIIAIGRDISERKRAEEALRQSESKYRDLVENHNDVIFAVDASGIIQYISPAISSITGYTPAEVTGRNLFDFFSLEDRQPYIEQLQRTVAAGSSVGEFAITVKDGSRKWVRASSRCVVEDGNVIGVHGIMSDITQRKQDEEQIRFLGSITENTTDAIMVTDADFFITYINKVAEQFFGYTLAELRGKTPGLLNADPHAAQVQKRVYETVAGGGTYLGESLNRRKDGSTFYCEYKVMPLKGEDGKIHSYFSLQRDVSERKRAEAALRQSEETFRSTFEAIPDPAYIWERQPEGRVVLGKYNQAALRITRKGIRKFLGIEPEKLFADHPDFAKKIVRTMDRGRPQSEEVLYQYRSTGESRWLVVDYVKTAADKVLVITKDVSGRKEAERALLAYQEQLRALSSELTLVEERERRRIAAELHDQIGQNLALCKLKVAALEKAAAGDDRLSELSAVRRLLEVSIQDARSLIFDISPPILYELGFPAALEWLAERIGEQYGVAVDFEDRAPGAVLETDRQVLLFQVVRELLINVGKHAHASRAKVILTQEGRTLRIQVNDDGVGFDPGSIIDPKDAKTSFGFFSMRERLNYLGGNLEARSKPGQGSQIVLAVPQNARPHAAGKEDA